MSNKPIDDGIDEMIDPDMVAKVLTPEAVEAGVRALDSLYSCFPADRCRELVKLTLSEMDAQIAREDSVIMPGLDAEAIEEWQTELEDSGCSVEEKREMQTLLSFAGKRTSELPRPTPEQDLESLEEETQTAIRSIVSGWINALYSARRKQTKGKQVRLDAALLPAPELTRNDGYDWDDQLPRSVALTIERVRELLSLFVTNLIPHLEHELVAHPEGVDITADDFLILRDADGFYIPPKAKV